MHSCDPERVAIEAGLQPVDWGVWEVAAVADGQQFRCSLPLGCPEGAGGSSPSTGGDTAGAGLSSAGAAGEVAGAATDPGASSGAASDPSASSCATPGTYPTLFGRCEDGPLELYVDLQVRQIQVSFYATPAAIEVSLLRDGQLLASGAFQPEYREVGNDCEACQLAEVTLTPAD